MKHEINRRNLIIGLSILVLITFSQVSAKGQNKQDSTLLEEVVVETERITDFSRDQASPEQSGSASPDASELVEEVSGADVTSNGPISGQIQYRGMTGDRMNVKINGHSVSPGGPNWMDPPLHYLPRSMMKDLSLTRGIAPVSSGIMTVGGTAEATMKSSEFTETSNYRYQGDLFGVTRSVDDGYTGGGVVGMANKNVRFHVMGNSDQGDDRAFPEGTVIPTEYDRVTSGFGLGLRNQGDTLGVTVRHTDTGKSGNPSLPMDIQYFNTEQGELKYSTTVNSNPVNFQVNYNDVDHRMDNFTLRPAPDFVPPGPMNPGPAFVGTDRRFVVAASNDLSLHSNTSFSLKEGNLELGFDYTGHDHNTTVFDPDSSFYVESFKDIKSDKLSGYMELSQSLSSYWDFTGGVRITQVSMDAGKSAADTTIPNGGATPPPLERLRNSFNSSKRNLDDLNVDLSVTFTRPINENIDLEFGLARKNRSPSYIERYAWVPVEATAGLADGNNHVGNRQLDPETSRDLEVALDWSPNSFYITPRFFYRDIDDYIQGTPNGISSDEETVSSVNGDTSPLKYNNVEAEIYGMDATWGHDLPSLRHLSLDGTFSYLKGERSDISDDLYRFAPPEASVRMVYRPKNWLFSAQGEFVQEQDDVSTTNNESPTPGYGLLNLKTRWFSSQRTTVTLALNNVLDKTYREHLSGFNRVSTSDVSVGTRLPGNERNGVLSVTYSW